MYKHGNCLHESELDLGDLFYKNNLDTNAMEMVHWMLFVLYVPFGVILCALRIALILSASLLLPVYYRYAFCQRIAGIRFSVTEKLHLKERGAFIVSNHSSYMDPVILNRALAKPDRMATVVWHGVNFFSRLICRPNISVQGENRNRDFLKKLRKTSRTHQVVVFPEGAVTDCISGLLRFQPSIFRLPQPIYLVAIRYKRAIPFFHGKALSRYMGFQFLLDLFQPWIQVELITVGLYERDISLTAQQQADKAQSLLADALGLSATHWDNKDRHSLLFE